MEQGAQVENEEIPQIESWFLDDDWHITKKEVEDRANEFPEKFFDHYIEEFWQCLTIMEIINLARAYKKAAYYAYGYNKAGFGNFCNKAWNQGILDLTYFQGLTKKTLRLIYTMFRANEVIFPANVPEEILDCLPHAQAFTFNLAWDRAYRIPNYASIRSARLIINGCFSLRLNDSVTPILHTFPRINTLTMHAIYFTRVSISALGTTKIRHLKLTKSSLWPSGEEFFVKALLNSAETLESLTIDSTSNYAWERTIKVLITKIKKFRRLRELCLTMKLNWRNAKHLKFLSTYRTLRNVQLISYHFGEMGRYEQVENNIRAIFQSRGIPLNIERRDMENAPTFLESWQ